VVRKAQSRPQVGRELKLPEEPEGNGLKAAARQMLRLVEATHTLAETALRTSEPIEVRISAAVDALEKWSRLEDMISVLRQAGLALQYDPTPRMAETANIFRMRDALKHDLLREIIARVDDTLMETEDRRGDQEQIDSTPSVLGYTYESPSSEAAVAQRPRMKETDTIDEFAARYGMTVAQLKEAIDYWKATRTEVTAWQTADLAATKLQLREETGEANAAISDAEAVKLVFGNVPEGFRTSTYTRNPHPELVHHPAVLAQAREIANANRRTKIATLPPPEREQLREARRILQANRRRISARLG